MGKCLIYDCETNSLDTEKGFIQELAWAVYDTESWRLLHAKSEIISWPLFYEVAPEALDVTGLTFQFCKDNGCSVLEVFQKFLIDLSHVDMLCGHNSIMFDKPMLLSNISRATLGHSENDALPLTTLLHLDTLYDVELPRHIKVKQLKYLAFEHGHIMSNAHQALADVFACASILSKYPIERTIEIAKTPLVKISRRIDWADLKAKENLQRAGFFWNAKVKQWEKMIREIFLPNIQLQLGTDAELGIEKTI